MSDSVLWGFGKTRQSAEKVSECAKKSHVHWTLLSIDEKASVTGICGTDSENISKSEAFKSGDFSYHTHQRV